ncbi:hypothetical protein B0H16DRAFT_1880398 [Mycena metata]|uniref:DUF6533 domain-containing protein n=1 Tax=Mycena metata TaxID=1033252 RepID=A0AAD7JXB9_9AGAR|nr:hypothetical protein B0H16DRAFT_1880398 [Mycena metata]
MSSMAIEYPPLIPPTASSFAISQQIFAQNCGHLVGVAILYWDHAITLDAEVHFFWRSRRSTSGYWFYVNRYVGFFAGIPVAVLPFLPLSTENCTRYTFLRQVALVVMQSIASIIMVIRVYALFGRSRRVLLFLVTLGLGVVVVGSYSLFGQKVNRRDDLKGCHFELSSHTAYRIAAGWEALFLLDSIIFGLTIYNAYINRKRTVSNDLRLNTSLSLHQVIIRDGALYFGMVALANLANISTYYLPGLLLPGTFATFANAITVTMVSRLMLNLHSSANVGIMSEITGLQNIPLKSLPHIPMIITVQSNQRDTFDYPAAAGARFYNEDSFFSIRAYANFARGEVMNASNSSATADAVKDITAQNHASVYIPNP